jgi:hypothetical protein
MSETSLSLINLFCWLKSYKNGQIKTTAIPVTKERHVYKKELSQLAQWLSTVWWTRGFDFRKQIFPNCSDNCIKHLTLPPIWPSFSVPYSKHNTTYQNMDIVRR